MVPPLGLIFLVLGTIFIGLATPTEGGAMGAAGAMMLAMVKRRMTCDLMRQAIESTAKLSAFVLFILVGARVFSLTFYGVSGHVWVEHLLTSLPGGQDGLPDHRQHAGLRAGVLPGLLRTRLHRVPLIGPAADKLGIDLIWFGVILGVNMQTSFMHPPFGFALFYLRSVAPEESTRTRSPATGCSLSRPGRSTGAPCRSWSSSASWWRWSCSSRNGDALQERGPVVDQEKAMEQLNNLAPVDDAPAARLRRHRRSSKSDAGKRKGRSSLRPFLLARAPRPGDEEGAWINSPIPRWRTHAGRRLPQPAGSRFDSCATKNPGGEPTGRLPLTIEGRSALGARADHVVVEGELGHLPPQVLVVPEGLVASRSS